MVQIRTGAGVVGLSGSIAGNTFSRNRSGAYIRTRTVVTNPNTARQVKARSCQARLAQNWSSVLTNVERAGWEGYAQAIKMKNRLGETHNLTGQMHYIRSNLARLYADLALVSSAPTIFNLAEKDPTLSLCPWPTGLVNCWPLNEGSGNKTYDLFGAKTSTLYGDTLWADGKFGKCLSFDHTGDYVWNTNIGSFPQLTLSWWAKKNPYVGPTKRDFWDTNGIYVFTNAVNGARGILLGDGTNWSGSLYTAAITDNVWHHIVIVYDGTVIKAYVNGVLQTNTVAWNKTVLFDFTYISGPADSSFDGLLDNILLFNRALTQAEVTQLYGCALPWLDSRVAVFFDTALPWLKETGGYMLVSSSRPQNSSRNFCNGPWQYCGFIAGSTVSPPLSPQPINLPFVPVYGQKFWLKIVNIRADGRTSEPYTLQYTILDPVAPTKPLGPQALYLRDHPSFDKPLKPIPLTAAEMAEMSRFEAMEESLMLSGVE